MNLNEGMLTGVRARRGRSRRANVVTIQRGTQVEVKSTKRKKDVFGSSSSYTDWKNDTKFTQSEINMSTTTRSVNSLDQDSRVILAITEGRGEATFEVGMAAINVDRPVLILCQISDTQSYVNVLTKINILNPMEILIPLTMASSRLTTKIREHFADLRITGVQRSTCNKSSGMQYITRLCAPTWNSIFLILQHKYYALTAASALLTYTESHLYVRYVKESIKVEYEESEGCAIVDVSTADKLELVSCALPDVTSRHSSLLGILNKCVTKMGARTLRAAILQPPCRVQEIVDRLNCVEELAKNPERVLTIQDLLKKISTMDRLLSLATLTTEHTNSSSTRQLNYILMLNSVFEVLAPLGEALQESEQPFFVELCTTLDSPELVELRDAMRSVVNPNARASSGEQCTVERCFAIRFGFNELLDIVRKKYSERLDGMQQYVRELADTHGLDLKLSNSTKKGYHIVLSLGSRQRKNFKKSDLPHQFIQVERMTTMVTMKTPKLLTLTTCLEEIIVEIIKMSNCLINKLLIEARKHVPLFYKLCEQIAKLDMLQSLAKASSDGSSYTRPNFNEFTEVVDSRHPLLDFLCETEPVPNNIFASSHYPMHIITGPNGSGKSIFIRQVVLLQVMAQIGCFVPARRATFRVTDRILARICLDDNMDCGASTFVLEMKEIQYFLTVMTKNTLIIIDELCRSTSVNEGTALAMAICEHMLKSSAFIFFTTHYTFITKLYDMYLNVKCWQLETKVISINRTRNLQFSYKVLPGVNSLEEYAICLARTCWHELTIKDAEDILKSQKKNDKYANSYKIDPKLRIKYDLEADLQVLNQKGQLNASVLVDTLKQYETSLREHGIEINWDDDDDDSESSDNFPAAEAIYSQSSSCLAKEKSNQKTSSEERLQFSDDDDEVGSSSRQESGNRRLEDSNKCTRNSKFPDQSDEPNNSPRRFEPYNNISMPPNNLASSSNTNDPNNQYISLRSNVDTFDRNEMYSPNRSRNDEGPGSTFNYLGTTSPSFNYPGNQNPSDEFISDEITMFGVTDDSNFRSHNNVSSTSVIHDFEPNRLSDLEANRRSVFETNKNTKSHYDIMNINPITNQIIERDTNTLFDYENHMDTSIEDGIGCKYIQDLSGKFRPITLDINHEDSLRQIINCERPSNQNVSKIIQGGFGYNQSIQYPIQNQVFVKQSHVSVIKSTHAFRSINQFSSNISDSQESTLADEVEGFMMFTPTNQSEKSGYTNQGEGLMHVAPPIINISQTSRRTNQDEGMMRFTPPITNHDEGFMHSPPLITNQSCANQDEGLMRFTPPNTNQEEGFINFPPPTTNQSQTSRCMNQDFRHFTPQIIQSQKSVYTNKDQFAAPITHQPHNFTSTHEEGLLHPTTALTNQYQTSTAENSDQRFTEFMDGRNKTVTPPACSPIVSRGPRHQMANQSITSCLSINEHQFTLPLKLNAERTSTPVQQHPTFKVPTPISKRIPTTTTLEQSIIDDLQSCSADFEDEWEEDDKHTSERETTNNSVVIEESHDETRTEYKKNDENRNLDTHDKSFDKNIDYTPDRNRRESMPYRSRSYEQVICPVNQDLIQQMKEESRCKRIEDQLEQMDAEERSQINEDLREQIDPIDQVNEDLVSPMNERSQMNNSRSHNDGRNKDESNAYDDGVDESIIDEDEERLMYEEMRNADQNDSNGKEETTKRLLNVNNHRIEDLKEYKINKEQAMSTPNILSFNTGDIHLIDDLERSLIEEDVRSLLNEELDESRNNNGAYHNEPTMNRKDYGTTNLNKHQTSISRGSDDMGIIMKELKGFKISKEVPNTILTSIRADKVILDSTVSNKTIDHCNQSKSSSSRNKDLGCSTKSITSEHRHKLNKPFRNYKVYSGSVNALQTTEVDTLLTSKNKSSIQSSVVDTTKTTLSSSENAKAAVDDYVTKSNTYMRESISTSCKSELGSSSNFSKNSGNVSKQTKSIWKQPKAREDPVPSFKSVQKGSSWEGNMDSEGDFDTSSNFSEQVNISKTISSSQNARAAVDDCNSFDNHWKQSYATKSNTSMLENKQIRSKLCWDSSSDIFKISEDGSKKAKSIWKQPKGRDDIETGFKTVPGGRLIQSKILQEEIKSAPITKDGEAILDDHNPIASGRSKFGIYENVKATKKSEAICKPGSAVATELDSRISAQAILDSTQLSSFHSIEMEKDISQTTENLFESSTMILLNDIDYSEDTREGNPEKRYKMDCTRSEGDMSVDEEDDVSISYSPDEQYLSSYHKTGQLKDISKICEEMKDGNQTSIDDLKTSYQDIISDEDELISSSKKSTISYQKEDILKQQKETRAGASDVGKISIISSKHTVNNLMGDRTSETKSKTINASTNEEDQTLMTADIPSDEEIGLNSFSKRTINNSKEVQGSKFRENNRNVTSEKEERTIGSSKCTFGYLIEDQTLGAVESIGNFKNSATSRKKDEISKSLKNNEGVTTNVEVGKSHIRDDILILNTDDISICEEEDHFTLSSQHQTISGTKNMDYDNSITYNNEDGDFVTHNFHNIEMYGRIGMELDEEAMRKEEGLSQCGITVSGILKKYLKHHEQKKLKPEINLNLLETNFDQRPSGINAIGSNSTSFERSSINQINQNLYDGRNSPVTISEPIPRDIEVLEDEPTEDQSCKNAENFSNTANASSLTLVNTSFDLSINQELHDATKSAVAIFEQSTRPTGDLEVLTGDQRFKNAKNRDLEQSSNRVDTACMYDQYTESRRSLENDFVREQKYNKVINSNRDVEIASIVGYEYSEEDRNLYEARKDFKLLENDGEQSKSFVPFSNRQQESNQEEGCGLFKIIGKNQNARVLNKPTDQKGISRQLMDSDGATSASSSTNKSGTIKKFLDETKGTDKSSSSTRRTSKLLLGHSQDSRRTEETITTSTTTNSASTSKSGTIKQYLLDIKSVAAAETITPFSREDTSTSKYKTSNNSTSISRLESNEIAEIIMTPKSSLERTGGVSKLNTITSNESIKASNLGSDFTLNINRSELSGGVSKENTTTSRSPGKSSNLGNDFTLTTNKTSSSTETTPETFSSETLNNTTSFKQAFNKKRISSSNTVKPGLFPSETLNSRTSSKQNLGPAKNTSNSSLEVQKSSSSCSGTIQNATSDSVDSPLYALKTTNPFNSKCLKRKTKFPSQPVASSQKSNLITLVEQKTSSETTLLQDEDSNTSKASAKRRWQDSALAPKSNIFEDTDTDISFGLGSNKSLNMLSKREIEQSYMKTNLKLMSLTGEECLKYSEELLNRPSAKQLRRSTQLVTAHKGRDGTVRVTTPREKAKRKRRKFLPPLKNTNHFDVTIFSDRNSERYQQFLQTRVDTEMDMKIFGQIFSKADEERSDANAHMK